MDTKKILAVLIAIIMLITLIGPASANTKRAAKVIELSGTVHYQKGGGDRQLKAFKGMSLAQGDRLITGKDGKATLEIDNDKKVTIGPNSNVDLSQLSGEKGKDENTRLNLRRGEIVSEIGDKLNAGSRFEIKTPTAVMGVRGTWFTVSHQNNGTYIAVIEGSLYALSTTPGEDADRLSAFLEENEQLSLADLESLAAGVTAEPLALADLPLTALEDLQANTDKLPPALKEQVEKEAGKIIADKKEQQQAAADQQAAAEGQLAGTSPGIEPTTPAAPPAPSGGGGDTGGGTPPTQPTDPEPPMGEPKLYAFPGSIYFDQTEPSGYNTDDPLLIVMTLSQSEFTGNILPANIELGGILSGFEVYDVQLTDNRFLHLELGGSFFDSGTGTIRLTAGSIKNWTQPVEVSITVNDEDFFGATGRRGLVVFAYRDKNDNPISGATFVADYLGEMPVTTNADGYCWFRTSGLYAGDYSYIIKLNDTPYQAGTLAIQENNTPWVYVEAKKEEPGGISGFVRDSQTEAALEGATVKVFLVVGGEPYYAASGEAITDSTGKYSIAGLAPGTYMVEAGSSGYEYNFDIEINIETGKTGEQDIYLLSDNMQPWQLYAYPSELLIPAAGREFTTADTLKVDLFLSSGEFVQTISPNSLRFEEDFEELGLSVLSIIRPEDNIGKLIIQIIGTIPTGTTGTGRIILPAEAVINNMEELAVDIAISSAEPPSGSAYAISGNVVDQNWSPMSGIAVNIYKKDNGDYPDTPSAIEVQTDGYGRYTFYLAEPGTYKVEIADGSIYGVAEDINADVEGVIVEAPIIRIE